MEAFFIAILIRTRDCDGYQCLCFAPLQCRQMQEISKLVSVATLRDYVLIDQDAIAVEHRWLKGDFWRAEHARSLTDTVRLNEEQWAVPLREIYNGVTL